MQFVDGCHVYIHHGHAKSVPRHSNTYIDILKMSWRHMDGVDKRGMQDGKAACPDRQGGDFVWLRGIRVSEQSGKSSRTFFRVLGDNGGPLLGGTALKGWSALGKLGTLCLPLAQGTGPLRRGALSVRGGPPSPPKVPGLCFGATREVPKGIEGTYLVPFLHFPFSIPLLSPPHPAFASFVKLAVALSPCSGSKSISCPGLSPS